MYSNIVRDIKQAIKTLIENNIDPVGSITTGSGGVAPSAKLPSVTTEDGDIEPQIMPQIQIVLVSDIPNLNRNQSYNAKVFYRSPDTDVPGVEVTAFDEAGNAHTGPYYEMRYFQPQKYAFRFRVVTLAENVTELEDIHTQLQAIFEGQRISRLRVVRNSHDEGEYEETFDFKSLGGVLQPFDGQLARSVIELEVQAYHDTALPPTKVFKIRSHKVSGYVDLDI